jgi:SAM-dependent methyltransferase
MRPLAYHEVMGLLEVGDLHPGGPLATDFLLRQLDSGRPLRVLEIGAGVGRTTERMLRRGWSVTPIEPNVILRSILVRRLGIDAFPGELETFQATGTFDAVIAESVIYGTRLADTFAQVHRLLKPGGLFGFVDMVWTESADPAAVREIYERTLKAFGIPMVSPEACTWPTWRASLAQAGFDCVVESRLPLGLPGRSESKWRLLATGFRHPRAFAQFMRYRRNPVATHVPPGWLESWMAVWKRGDVPTVSAK